MRYFKKEKKGNHIHVIYCILFILYSLVLCLIKDSSLIYVMLCVGLCVVCIFPRIQKKVLKYFPCGRVEMGTMYANVYRNYRVLVCILDLCEILYLKTVLQYIALM